MSGRSGGGAYSWWVSALDDRVKVAVPVAGITDLQNHIVDGCIAGHCDCMYMINRYRWDFAQVAAMLAPRPLLLSNSDKDTIFPLDGVLRVHSKVRDIYRLYKAEDKLGLLITEGPHKDTQELQVPAMRWFNRFLKNEDKPVDTVATKLFEPEQLRVFAKLPEDQINTKIHETFVPMASATLPANARQWNEMRQGWMKALREKCFAGWPAQGTPPEMRQVFSAEQRSITLRAYDFLSQSGVSLRLYLLSPARLERPEQVVLQVLDEEQYQSWSSMVRAGFADALKDEPAVTPDDAAFEKLVQSMGRSRVVQAYLAPRGIGPTAWTTDAAKNTHYLRRFALLGQTLDGMRVWDVRRIVAAIRSLPLKEAKLSLQARGRMAGVALYASLFEDGIDSLELTDLPQSHRDGPDIPFVLRYLDMPQALAMAAERTKVTLRGSTGGQYPIEVARRLKWPDDRIRVAP